MGSKLRIWEENTIHHVTGRGIRREALFLSYEDFLTFLLILKKVKEETDIEIYSLCLMSNHFHLLIGTTDVPLWDVMNHLMSRYARNFNRRHGYSGHVFEKRYGSVMVQDARHLLEASRYIHCNPVKANMVETPEEYMYSNYRVFIGQKKEDADSVWDQLLEEVTDSKMILEYFGCNAEDKYHKYVEEKLMLEEMEIESEPEMMGCEREAQAMDHESEAFRMDIYTE